MDERPWTATIAGCFLILVSMVVLGALWSGSPGGDAFAETATASYDSSWLPWAGSAVIAGCGAGILLGWPMARLLVLIWMGWGIFEGLVLLSPVRFSVWTIGAYIVTAVLLFLPPSNEWFQRGKMAAAY